MTTNCQEIPICGYVSAITHEIPTFGSTSCFGSFIVIAKENARFFGYENLHSPVASFVEMDGCTKCLLSSTSKWVTDSGASDHMTGNHHLLSDFRTHTSTSHVTIFDGSTPQVLEFGTVDLGPSISLSSVLSLPNF
ncbi:unnamed protein product [Lactuca virosa]|uniref:Retrovirus-related Pol polyprotein from transposon TNT 1-94-like beta-barrel domain-containing protein n=1 Tax=Lactuca virosa TaxID=75947 RepID=A0AAU9LRV8_9ASTR|nr:unnamed protein product [Lactuca virosa]